MNFISALMEVFRCFSWLSRLQFFSRDQMGMSLKYILGSEVLMNSTSLFPAGASRYMKHAGRQRVDYECYYYQSRGKPSSGAWWQGLPSLVPLKWIFLPSLSQYTQEPALGKLMAGKSAWKPREEGRKRCLAPRASSHTETYSQQDPPPLQTSTVHLTKGPAM